MAKERWNGHEYILDEEVDSFLAEIAEVCKKHGMSISHEDEHGAFIVEDYSEDNIKWLDGAFDYTDPIVTR